MQASTTSIRPGATALPRSTSASTCRNRRSEYVLATKSSRVGTVDGRAVWSAEHALRSIDESLTRLRTDYVDVLQLHNPKPDDLESTGLLDALLKIQRQGKARWVGISTNLPYLPVPRGRRRFRRLPDQLLHPAAGARELDHQADRGRTRDDSPDPGGQRRARHRGIAGSLPRDHGSATDEERWANFEKANLDELREEGESRAAFNLRYTFAHPDISTVIVGALDPAHVRQNVRMLEKGPLAPDVMAEVHRRLAPLGFRVAPVA